MPAADLLISVLVRLTLCALILSPLAATAQQGDDPFAVVARHRGTDAAAVPPRALAVIPERNVNRLIRVTDVLVAIDPQFDDLATGAGLDGRQAIQLRTREARVPIFVPKTEATIATLLQLPIGARVEVIGVLVPRSGRYLFLAAEIRPSPARRR